MSDSELLLAISNIVQAQIKPLKNDIKDIKITLENDILPRLQKCENNNYQIDSIKYDIELITKVVLEHSEKLQ